MLSPTTSSSKPRTELLRDPHLDAAEIDRIAAGLNSHDSKLSVLIAAHPNTRSDTLARLVISHPIPSVFNNLLLRPRLDEVVTKEMVIALISKMLALHGGQSAYGSIMVNMIANEAVLPQQVEWMLATFPVWMYSQLFGKVVHIDETDSWPPEVLAAIVIKAREKLNPLLAAVQTIEQAGTVVRERVKDDPAWERLVSHKYATVRMQVAVNPNLPKHYLARMADDRSIVVRRALAFAPGLDENTITKLACIGDTRLGQILMQNPNLPEHLRAYVTLGT